jgi:hypothetical protein
MSKVPKKRVRITDGAYYTKEQSTPFQAPKWTISGYDGSLKSSVKGACSERSSSLLPSPRSGSSYRESQRIVDSSQSTQRSIARSRGASSVESTPSRVHSEEVVENEQQSEEN